MQWMQHRVLERSTPMHAILSRVAQACLDLVHGNAKQNTSLSNHGKPLENPATHFLLLRRRAVQEIAMI